MSENGIDISKHYPKSLDQYLTKKFDIIITTCDKAKQSCPAFPGNALRYHWNLNDPSDVEDENKRLIAFRNTFADISKRVDELIDIIKNMPSDKEKGTFLVLDNGEL